MRYDDEQDDFRAERAYDRAKRAWQAQQDIEDRETGARLDPMPSFDEWENGVDQEDAA
jgi:hypothetical protein